MKTHAKSPMRKVEIVCRLAILFSLPMNITGAQSIGQSLGGSSYSNPWNVKPDNTMFSFSHALAMAGQQRIVFSSNRDGNFEIYRMNSDGTELLRLTNNTAQDGSPVWSFDGTQIAFGSDREGNFEIYKMNADGTNPINLTNNAATDAGAAWSPDGQRIAFSSNRDGSDEIYIMNVDGSNPVRLTYNSANDGGPDWSPDGSKIVFVSNRDGNEEIYVMNSDGSNQTRLTNQAGADRQPSWSPDGTRIAFTGNDPTGAVWIMNADGSNAHALNDWGSDPDWSPDGTQITFVGPKTSSDEISVINADGTNSINLTNNPATDSQPSWSPAPSVVDPPPVASAGDDQEIVIGASTRLGGDPTASDGVSPYTFSWTPTAGLDDPSSANPVASPMATTTYIVTVTDANGASSTDEATVLVHDFVLFAADYVKINRSLDSDGNIHVNGKLDFFKGGPSKHTGNLTAVGNISIKAANTIVGDVTAGGQVNLSGNAQIVGAWKDHAKVASIPRPIFSFSAGGMNRTVARNGSLSIPPGTYGTVTVNSNGTLNLGAGEYFFSTIDIKSSARVSCDVSSGAVKINVVKETKLAARAQILTTGGGTSLNNVVIATQQRRKFDIGKESHIEARLLAPLSLVKFGSGSSIVGSVCADSVLINANVAFLPYSSLTNQIRTMHSGVVDEGEGEVDLGETASPSSYSLLQNYPNPFNASTTLRYELPARTHVQLEIIDALGRQISVLVDEGKDAGYHEVHWQANNIASGVYFYRLRAGSFSETKKLILLR